MFPENLVQACFQQVKTVYKNVPNPRYNASSNESGQEPFNLVRDVEYTQGMNVLGTHCNVARSLKLSSGPNTFSLFQA